MELHGAHLLSHDRKPVSIRLDNAHGEWGRSDVSERFLSSVFRLYFTHFLFITGYIGRVDDILIAVYVLIWFIRSLLSKNRRKCTFDLRAATCEAVSPGTQSVTYTTQEQEICEIHYCKCYYNIFLYGITLHYLIILCVAQENIIFFDLSWFVSRLGTLPDKSSPTSNKSIFEKNTIINIILIYIWMGLHCIYSFLYIYLKNLFIFL